MNIVVIIPVGQYANSPPVTGPTVTQNSPFSSQAVAVTIANIHFAYPQRDDQAELAWVAWLNTEMVYLQMITHLSTNPAQRGVTLLVCPLPNDVTTKPNCYQCHTQAVTTISRVHNNVISRTGNCSDSFLFIA